MHYVAVRRHSTFLSKTCRKKMSYADKARRTLLYDFLCTLFMSIKYNVVIGGNLICLDF